MGQAKLKAALNASLRTKGFSGRDTAAHEVAHAVMTVLVGQRVKEVDIHHLPSPIEGRSKKIPSTGPREGRNRKAENKRLFERSGLPDVCTAIAAGIYEAMVSPSNLRKVGIGARWDIRAATYHLSFIWQQNLAPSDGINSDDEGLDKLPRVPIENRRSAWLIIHRAVRPVLEHHAPVLRQLTEELLNSPKGRLRGGRILEAVSEFHKERPFSTDAVMEKLSLELTALLGTPQFPPVFVRSKDGFVLGAATGFSDPTKRTLEETPRIRRAVEGLVSKFVSGVSTGIEPKQRKRRLPRKR